MRVAAEEKFNLRLNTMGSSSRSRLLHFALRRDHDIIWLHLAFGVFAVFTLWMALVHVPWRDEAQAWLIARDSNFWQLFIELRHEGHPLLWYLCLKAVQATGANYLGMMLLNWFFVVAGIWLLFYRSTLPLLARLGVAFAPVCVFELAYIARNYGMAIPLCFLAAVLYREVEAKPLRYSFVLVLLANTNIYASAVFIGISFQFLLEQMFAFGRKPFSLQPLYTKYLGANAILFAGALLLIAELAPVRLPGDSLPNVSAALSIDFFKLFKPLVAISFLVPAALVFFRKDPEHPRVFGGIAMVLVAALPAIFHDNNARYSFMLALGVVYFCWIYLDSFIGGATYFTKRLGPIGIKTLATFLIILVSLGSRQWGFRQLINRPFDSRRTAEAVIQHQLDRPDTLLVTTDPVRVTPLFLFFKSIRADYGPAPFDAAPQSFSNVAYLPFRKGVPSLQEIKPLVLEIARKNPSKTILVVSIGPEDKVDFPNNDPGYPLVPVYQTPPSPRYNEYSGYTESYQVYVLKRQGP